MNSIITHSRDSFDRFGDDLCQVILSHLSISDCFRLQCVSNQFNRLVFKTQTKLTLIADTDEHSIYFHNYMEHSFDKYSFIEEIIVEEANSDYEYYEVNHYLLEYVLKNCANINDLQIVGGFLLELNDDTFQTIINSGKQLKNLTIIASLKDISSECLQQFTECCLKNLESLSFRSLSYASQLNSRSQFTKSFIKSIITFAPKLKSLDCEPSIQYILEECIRDSNFEKNSMNFIKKLNHYRIREKQFVSFANYFRQQLNSISATINSDLSWNTIQHLASFEKLEYLYCHFSYVTDSEYNASALKLIKLVGTKCVALKVLAIQNLASNLNDVFSGGFKSLDTLILKDRRKFCTNIEMLRNCLNLTRIEFCEFDAIESNFKDIDKYLPKLKSIDINSGDFNDKENARKIMEHLQRLPKLRELYIGIADPIDFDERNWCTIDNIISFIDNCFTIRSIGIYPEDCVIDISIIREHIQNNKRKINIITLNHKCSSEL